MFNLSPPQNSQDLHYMYKLEELFLYNLCESRVQTQVGSGDTAHGRLSWRVSPLATHAEPELLIRIISKNTEHLKSKNL